MSKDNFMLVADATFDRLLTLSDDRRLVRFLVRQFRVEGLFEPLRVTLVFDAETVDEILQRLMDLRARMRSRH